MPPLEFYDGSLSNELTNVHIALDLAKRLYLRHFPDDDEFDSHIRHCQRIANEKDKFQANTSGKVLQSAEERGHVNYEL